MGHQEVGGTIRKAASSSRVTSCAPLAAAISSHQ
jgi:hypothetical protein